MKLLNKPSEKCAISASILTVNRRRHHITQLVSSCFGTLRQLAELGKVVSCNHCPIVLTSDTCESFSMTKVDYCNVALAGLPRCDLDRSQTIVNAVRRLTDDDASSITSHRR